MEFVDYLRLTGWILVFLFPLYVVYKTGGPNAEPLLDDVEYERRKRLKQQKELKVVPIKDEKKPLLETTTTTTSNNNTKKNKKKNKKKPLQKKVEANDKKQEQVVKKEEKPVEEKPVEEKKVEDNTLVEEPVKEIDEHMDPTAHYARVMRIKPEEEEEEWEQVPYEEGWSQVKSRRSYSSNTSQSTGQYVDNNSEITSEDNSRYIPGLSKKQRENKARQMKKKEQKLAADVIQAQRLRQHQKQLEKIKIQEFYSTGQGKNTPWGKNGKRASSSKVPTSTASVNEYGQLIWD
ncbi:MAG: hypothetical protein EXX96DRAFT_581438 [Benjaminiella poitrasii]|nr:MAG: hypothetical protein EXX96DRAFT_581438 [Benjaminiella poitrasii]